MNNRLREGVVAAAAALFLAATALPAAVADTTAPDPTQYAALGDSFAAGVGVQEADAYPSLLAGGLDRHTFLAVSGATTQSVVAGQIPQVPAGAEQITLTVGGNNLGFVQAMLACAPGLNAPGCAEALGHVQTAAAALPEEMVNLLLALRAQAPQAMIYVTNYPQLLQPAADGTCTTLDLAQIPYDGAALQFADDAVTDVLNPAIAGAVAGLAQATGDEGLVHVDVVGAFDGNGVCNPTGYIAPPSFDGQVPAPSSLHPNAAGQQAYADAITAAGFVTPTGFGDDGNGDGDGDDDDKKDDGKDKGKGKGKNRTPGKPGLPSTGD